MTSRIVAPEKDAPLRRIPIGSADWPFLRRNNFLLVDKTPLIGQLVTKYLKVFIARPRRFGKTVLILLLEELFTHGDRNLESTAIFGHWPFPEPCPVISFSFLNITTDNITLDASGKTDLTSFE